MLDFLRQLFSSGDFMPHGYCYLWDPGLVWLHVISDSLITLAYFVIPVLLLWLVRKRRDIPFNWMFVCFGVFIVACGSTHAMEIWNLWHADYWLSGVIKAITAVASVGTAILLVQLIPQAVELPSPQQMQKVIDQLHQQAELLDLAHDAIFVRDLHGAIVYWNRGAETMYGWTPTEACGHITHELLRSQYPQPLSEIESTVIEKGGWEGELVHQTSEGKEVTVASRWSLRREPDGQPVSILEVNRDITARKKAEAKFRDLLEAAPDAMVIVDQQGTIVLANAQTQKLFGYTTQELLGQPVEILMPEGLRKKHANHRDVYVRVPRARPMGAGLELSGRRREGSEFPVEISLSPLQTEQGTLVISAIRNIAERKNAEAVRALHMSELARTNSALAAANQELESFSYSVSHDLRAPLRHIDGFSRILLEEYKSKLDAHGRHYLQRIADGAKQMGRLVDDLLNFSRLGRQELKRQPTNLTPIVNNVRIDLAESAAGRTVEWKIAPLPAVDCDPSLIKVVFTNLLSNALKFTAPRPQTVIELGCTEVEKQQAFFVRDNGVGFDAKYADKLFGVFQRLHRQEDFEGTGVGLATVQRIIHKHGGRIWAESEPDRGATFFFTLGNDPGAPHESKTEKEAVI
ncbi:MAG TPA: PAS domain S-box protein [Candidatus Acidoferrales bacterium]|nr:PAS domain S-box protein [Candidatus Acidoferrales bacterium]